MLTTGHVSDPFSTLVMIHWASASEAIKKWSPLFQLPLEVVLLTRAREYVRLVEINSGVLENWVACVSGKLDTKRPFTT